MATVARGKGRPRLIEAAEIDRAIRDAALAVLLEHGEAATMHAVAVAAGLSRKSLYARYPNKSELFLGVIREMLQGAGALNYDTSGATEDKLHNYIRAALAVISRPQSQALQRLLTMDPAYIAALRAEMFDATRRLFFDPLLGLLIDAKGRGELAVDDPQAAARVILRLILTESLVSQKDEGSWLSSGAPDDYARFLTKFVTQGLLPR